MTKEEAITNLEMIRIAFVDAVSMEQRKLIDDTFEMAIQALEQMSGKWIPIPYEIDYESDAKCSLCHSEFINAITYNYCPNCGARMEDKND